ncbi:MAG: hypothetical protein CMB80_01885 [Flammeovirgaceae bacterium]|nr:hypothetical protein [Flammeovirgaceae bacterium]|tara:strand:+ start:57 stop:392 length:336 start_codon:yes stop_codon:yes gene_type:complete
MELNRDNKESWLFAVWEGLEDFKSKAMYAELPIKKQWIEVEIAMKWIELALIPKPSEEKLTLMQNKNLLQQLYIVTMSGVEQLSPEECSQIADMLLRRKGKDYEGSKNNQK